MNSMDLRRGRKVGGRNLSPSSASKLPTFVIEEDRRSVLSELSFVISRHQSSSIVMVSCERKKEGGREGN